MRSYVKAYGDSVVEPKRFDAAAGPPAVALAVKRKHKADVIAGANYVLGAGSGSPLGVWRRYAGTGVEFQVSTIVAGPDQVIPEGTIYLYAELDAQTTFLCTDMNNVHEQIIASSLLKKFYDWTLYSSHARD